MTTDTPAQPAPPEDPPAPPRARSWRPLLLRLHFYAGVLIAPFLLVAALSGALYAVTPQVERVVYADELTTDARGPAVPLDEQVAAAREVQPDLPLVAVRPAPEPGATTRVMFDDGETATSRTLAVFVDPVTAEVTGELTAYGTSGALPLRTWVDELHRSLHLGDTGRLYSELAASWLWVVALAGVALWWTGPQRRNRRVRRVRGATGRLRTRAVHGLLGTVVAVGLVGLSATGLTWSQHAGANVTDLRAAMDWSTPAVVADLTQPHEGADEHAHHGGGHGGHGGHGDHGTTDPADGKGADAPGVGFQAALDAARAEGLGTFVEIGRPSSGTATYVVQEIDRSWPVQVDAAAVDPASGEVVDVVRFDDYPFMAKLARWGVDAHMGTLFGVVNQVVLLGLGLAIAAMVVTGYRMWWQRRPTRGVGRGGRVARVGRAPARGAWRSAPPVGIVLLGAVAVVVGWFLPLLGISLLVLLGVDLALGAAAARRERRTA
ncbi:PepSY domain-containing protein [Nocardioides zeae]|uniref:PepSY domain-containing protein n=1 Tax=Nocardioides imazamoxiresistens TaxID=3231893 RepID=A0ABU3PXT4_9ACTN|nr:PepSY domain-containing protein [Nocardioides zeae]MDT9594001.1 PepSY domain-containing protein [Nocardioides zeae]